MGRPGLIAFLRVEFASFELLEVGGPGEDEELVDDGHIDVADDAERIELDKVLFVSDGENVKIGTPLLEGAKVVASFKGTAGQAIVKGPKLYPTHFRRRKNSKRRIGHRQKYLQVVIEKIVA